MQELNGYTCQILHLRKNNIINGIVNKTYKLKNYDEMGNTISDYIGAQQDSNLTGRNESLKVKKCVSYTIYLFETFIIC